MRHSADLRVRLEVFAQRAALDDHLALTEVVREVRKLRPDAPARDVVVWASNLAAQRSRRRVSA